MVKGWISQQQKIIKNAIKSSKQGQIHQPSFIGKLKKNSNIMDNEKNPDTAQFFLKKSSLNPESSIIEKVQKQGWEGEKKKRERTKWKFFTRLKNLCMRITNVSGNTFVERKKWPKEERRKLQWWMNLLQQGFGVRISGPPVQNVIPKFNVHK